MKNQDKPASLPFVFFSLMGVTDKKPRLTFAGLGPDAVKWDADFQTGLVWPVSYTEGCC